MVAAKPIRAFSFLFFNGEEIGLRRLTALVRLKDQLESSRYCKSELVCGHGAHQWVIQLSSASLAKVVQQLWTDRQAIIQRNSENRAPDVQLFSIVVHK